MSNPPVKPGNIGRPPAQLVIKGFEGPSQARQLLTDKLAGQIKQFYLKQSQNHELGIIDQSRGERLTDDYRMTYRNIGGDERITVEVSQKLQDELLPETFTPYDWAIINLNHAVPNSATADFAAIMRVPAYPMSAAQRVTGATVSYGGSSAVGNRPISFPDHSNTDFTALEPVTSGDGFAASSLLIDLRVVVPTAGVVVDIYGNSRVPDPDGAACSLQVSRFPVTLNIAVPGSPGPDWQGTSIATAPTLDSYHWILRGDFSIRWPDCTGGIRLLHMASNRVSYGLGIIEPQLTQDMTFSHIVYGDRVLRATALRSGGTLTVTITDVTAEVLGLEDYVSDITVGGIYGDDPTAGLNGIPGDGFLRYTVSGREGVNGWVEGTYATSATVSYSNPGQTTGPAAASGGSSTANSGTQLNYNYNFVPYAGPTSLPTEPDPTAAATITTDITAVVGMGDPQWVYAEHNSGDASFDLWERREAYPGYPGMSTLERDIPLADGFANADASTNYGLTHLGTLVIDRRRGSATFKRA